MPDATAHLPSVQRRAEIDAFEQGRSIDPDPWTTAGLQIERVTTQLPCLTTTCQQTATVERGILRSEGHKLNGRIVVPGVQRCPECQARTRQRAAELEAQQAQIDAHSAHLTQPTPDPKRARPAGPYDAIPPDFRNASWDWVVEHHPTHAQLLNDWPTDPDSLYLFGGIGAGKSMLVSVLVKRLLDNAPSTIVAWRNVSLMLDRIRRSINRPERTESLIEQACDADLLVLDDIGAETTTRWLVDRLYVVIEDRIEQQRPTVITSNFPISELLAHLVDTKEARSRTPRVDAHGRAVKSAEQIAAERLISRIRGRHRVIRRLDGADHRIRTPRPTNTPGGNR